MKTLKKSLCFVLAVVMAVGTLVMSASAVFPDDDSIKDDYMDAAVLLKELAIIQGREDGSFDPTGTLSRVEAAWFIARLHIGASLANQLTTPVSSFSDMNGTNVNNNGRGVVEYCKTSGIINGRTADTYDPDGKVNYAEFAKMVLTALGYDSNLEGYTGANYAQAVLIRATNTGLIDGLKIDNMFGQITRQEAAKMIYNALFIEQVEYDVTDAGNNKGKAKPNSNYFCVSQNVLAESSNGKVTTNGDANHHGKLKPYMTQSTDAAGVVTKQFTKLNEKPYDTKMLADALVTFKSGEFTAEAIKDYKVNDATELKNAATDTYAVGNDTKLAIFYNGHQMTDADKFAGTVKAPINKLFDEANKSANNGISVKLYGTDAKHITRVVVEEPYFAVVSDLTADEVKVTVYEHGATQTLVYGKDEDPYKAITAFAAKGDYIQMFVKPDWENNFSKGTAKNYFYKAAPMDGVATGVVSGIYAGKNLSLSTVTVNGTAYFLNSEFQWPNNGSDKVAMAATLTNSSNPNNLLTQSLASAKDADPVVVNLHLVNGTVLGVSKVSGNVVVTEPTYAVVLDSTNYGNSDLVAVTHRAKLLFSDGNIATVTTKTSANSLKQQVVEYTEKDGVYTLTLPAAANRLSSNNSKSATVKLTASNPNISVSGADLYGGTDNAGTFGTAFIADKNTIVLVTKNTDGTGGQPDKVEAYARYVGFANLPSFVDGSSAVSVDAFSVVGDKGVAKVLYIEIDSTNIGKLSDDNSTKTLAFVANTNKGTYADALGSYEVYSAVVGGQIVDFKVKTGSVTWPSATGTVYVLGTYTETNGLVTSVSAASASDFKSGAIAGDYANNTIKIDSTTYGVDDNAKVFFVSGASIEAKQLSDLKTSDVTTLIFTQNTNGIITMIVAIKK